MKKSIKYTTLIFAIIGLTGNSIVKAETVSQKRYVLAYQAEPFQINEIYPSRNEITVHYFGVGDETKTNYLNVYWPNLSKITEEEMDIAIDKITISVPSYVNKFVNKKTELSPNTESTWRLWRYSKMGDLDLSEAPGILYYSTRLANGTFLRGKADYRDCLSNPLYIEAGEGAYCKLEQYEESGELYYWPYLWSVGRLGSDNEPVWHPDDAKDEEDDIEEEIEYEDEEEKEDEDEEKDEEDKDVEKEDGGEGNNRGGFGDDEVLINEAGRDINYKNSGQKEDGNDKDVGGKILIPRTPNTGFGC